MIKNEKLKSGFVAIVGEPNAGKSTLLNQILEQKIAITTSRKNTTRNQIRGIFNDKDSQIIFIDTPGFWSGTTKFDQKMKKNIDDAIRDVDIILFLNPFWKQPDLEYLSDKIWNNDKIKKLFLITKIDLAKNKEQIFKLGEKIIKINKFNEVLPISSIKQINIDNLITVLKKYLPEDIAYYDRKQSSELDDEFYISEIVREKVLVFLNDEIPHRIFVKTTRIEKSKTIDKIYLEIFVEKSSQKIIVIGKNGEKIKQISEAARLELERYFSKKIYLEVFVKIKKDWKNKEIFVNKL